MRNLPLLDDAQIADIQRRYRCELESLLAVDDGVKKVIAELEAKGDLDNTLIIYTSDNGYFHGEHRIPSEKLRVYEESIRVPLEMRGPGHSAGGDDRPAGDQRRPGADDRRGRRRDARPRRGWPVAPPGDPAARRPTRNRDLLIEEPTLKAIRTPRYLYAEYKNGEQRALRPAERPV